MKDNFEIRSFTIQQIEQATQSKRSWVKIAEKLSETLSRGHEVAGYNTGYTTPREPSDVERIRSGLYAQMKTRKPPDVERVYSQKRYLVGDENSSWWLLFSYHSFEEK